MEWTKFNCGEYRGTGIILAAYNSAPARYRRVGVLVVKARDPMDMGLDWLAVVSLSGGPLVVYASFSSAAGAIAHFGGLEQRGVAVRV